METCNRTQNAQVFCGSTQKTRTDHEKLKFAKSKGSSWPGTIPVNLFHRVFFSFGSLFSQQLASAQQTLNEGICFTKFIPSDMLPPTIGLNPSNSQTGRTSNINEEGAPASPVYLLDRPNQVQILDHVNKVKRISMVKEGSRHIDMDTDWETVPSDDDLEEAADSSQPIPREADLGDSLQTALEYAFCPVAQNFSCHSLFCSSFGTILTMHFLPSFVCKVKSSLHSPSNLNPRIMTDKERQVEL